MKRWRAPMPFCLLFWLGGLEGPTIIPIFTAPNGVDLVPPLKAATPRIATSVLVQGACRDSAGFLRARGMGYLVHLNGGRDRGPSPPDLRFYVACLQLWASRRARYPTVNTFDTILARPFEIPLLRSGDVRPTPFHAASPRKFVKREGECSPSSGGNSTPRAALVRCRPCSHFLLLGLARPKAIRFPPRRPCIISDHVWVADIHRLQYACAGSGLDRRTNSCDD